MNSQIFGGGGAAIKSIQAGTVSLGLGSASATATITSVDTTNALLFFTGFSSDDSVDQLASGGASIFNPQITLTNATTVTASHIGTGGTGTLTVGFMVVEFYPGTIKSVQRGSITIATSATTNTATITSVDTTKAFVVMLGMPAAAAASTDTTDKIYSRFTLTNATTVTLTRGALSVAFTATSFYQVVEFF